MSWRGACSKPHEEAAMRAELRVFHGVVGVVLLLPLLAGFVGAFGGIEGMAWLFGVQEPLAVPAVLRNNFRAIAAAFASWFPLVVWSLAALAERAAVFRIIVAFGFVAGLARLTGWAAEGNPGPLAAGILAIELAGMPLLLIWHARLVRAAGEAGPSR
jgi:hypothetical protein